MPRIARVAPGGIVYHVLNRGNGRRMIFHKDADARAFLDLLNVVRYAEANPLRAGMVDRAEDWPFSSLWHHARGTPDPLVDAWPVDRPDDWIERVNRPQDDRELIRLRTGLTRGRPYGCNDWVTRMCRDLGLQFTLRDRGRPRKSPDAGDRPGL
jgi:hypothetical protein